MFYGYFKCFPLFLPLYLMMAINCNKNPNTTRLTPIQAKRHVFIAFGLSFPKSFQVGEVLSSAPIAKRITPIIWTSHDWSRRIPASQFLAFLEESLTETPQAISVVPTVQIFRLSAVVILRLEYFVMRFYPGHELYRIQDISICACWVSTSDWYCHICRIWR